MPVFGRTFYVNLPILIVAWISEEDQGLCVQLTQTIFSYDMLNCIMDNCMPCGHVDQVLLTAFQLNDVNVIESIVNSHKWFGKSHVHNGCSMNECCKPGSLYDKPKYLSDFLENFPDRTEYKVNLFDMCKALDRDECGRALLKVAGPIDTIRPKSSIRDCFACSLESRNYMTPFLVAIRARIVAPTHTYGDEEYNALSSEQPGTSNSRTSGLSMLDFLNTELKNGRRSLWSLLEVVSPYFTSLADDSEEKLII